MKIQFVCTSNTFRSRLAEAYLKSKNIPGMEVSSSGVEAYKDPNGPITWYAQRIIEKNKLMPFCKNKWSQATKEDLEAQDLVIFMQPWHYKQAVEKFGFRGTNYKVWGVIDIVSRNLSDDQKITESEKIFDTIKTNIDNLIAGNFN